MILDDMPMGPIHLVFLYYIVLGQILVINTIIIGLRESFLRRLNYSSFDLKELPFTQEVRDPRVLEILVKERKR